MNNELNFEEILNNQKHSLYRQALEKFPQFKKYINLRAIENPEAQCKWNRQRDQKLRELYEYSKEMKFIDDNTTFEEFVK